MTLSEVYSANIMSWAIADFVNCRGDESNKIEDERLLFKRFIDKAEKSGLEFSSQLTAWDAYTEGRIILDETGEFDHLDEEVNTDVISWSDELVELWYSESNSPLNLGNYFVPVEEKSETKKFAQLGQQ